MEINDTGIYHPEDMNHFNEKGFSLREEITTDTFNFTVTVDAMPENNNTRITCLVYQQDYRSRSGRLTVMGISIIKHHSVIIVYEAQPSIQFTALYLMFFNINPKYHSKPSYRVLML